MKTIKTSIHLSSYNDEVKSDKIIASKTKEGNYHINIENGYPFYLPDSEKNIPIPSLDVKCPNGFTMKDILKHALKLLKDTYKNHPEYGYTHSVDELYVEEVYICKAQNAIVIGLGS